jgi:hypothetical protein
LASARARITSNPRGIVGSISLGRSWGVATMRCISGYTLASVGRSNGVRRVSIS